MVPHLGWPELPNKANWEKGKKVTARVPQPPPFVAHHADVDIASAVQARAAAIKVTKAVRPGKGIVKPSDAALGVPLPVGVNKQLLGPELTIIGRALMASPKLILFDEPSLGLQPSIVLQIFGIIRKIHERGVAILLVEQNVFQTLAITDRTYVLEHGKIVLEGRSDRLIDDDYIKKSYLAV